MIEVGRTCVKIAGRDAGKKAVIVDIIDDKYVLIDGEVRRRKCNINHLEFLDKKIEIKKNTSSEEIYKILGIEKKKTVKKEKKARPKKQRVKKTIPKETKAKKVKKKNDKK